MALDTLTIRLHDGIKGAVDYSPNKEYDITGILSSPSDNDAEKAVELIVKLGERFLGRAVPPVTTTKTTVKGKAETPASPPPPPPEPEAPPSTDLSDILGNGGTPPAEAAPKEVSDEEVVHAVMARAEALKDATKIRALVETYNPQPGLRVFKATEIGQAQRQEFLDKLAALT